MDTNQNFPIPNIVVSSKTMEVKTVTLTMDLATARILRSVMQGCGGATKGPRGVTNQIDDALGEQGVKALDKHTYGSEELFTGNIMFRDTFPKELFK